MGRAENNMALEKRQRWAKSVLALRAFSHCICASSFTSPALPRKRSFCLCTHRMAALSLPWNPLRLASGDRQRHPVIISPNFATGGRDIGTWRGAAVKQRQTGRL